jgi:alpha-amylase
LILPCAFSACSGALRGAPPAATAASAAPVSVERQREWADAIVYFAIVDRFADGDPRNNLGVDRRAKGTFHGGDLVGLRLKLDDLADLGVTAIWITPVVKNVDGFVTGAGFPDWAYHGYWADDFTTTDRRFGSEQELAELVEDCHRRGIKLLLDVVYNHVGYGSQYVTSPATRGWLRSEGAGTCGQDDVTSCVAGLPDLRTELPEVADYLMTAHLGLAGRTGLDGFRLDTVKHVAHEFWQEHRRRTRERLGDGFFLLGEVWGGDPGVLDPWFEKDEMDAGFDFAFQGSTLGFVQGRGRAVAYERYLEKRHAVRPGYHLAHYLSSHDVPTALYQLRGDVRRFRLAAILQFTTIGIPVIYYGEEVGRLGGEWPDNRSDMPWNGRDVLPGKGQPRDELLRRDYRRLIAIRRAHAALWRGTHRGLVHDGDLLVFAREDPRTGETVIVAVNRAALPLAVEFPRPQAWVGRDVLDTWAERPVEARGDTLRIEVAALDAAILSAGPSRQP